jgi:hypothetical protein
MLKHFLEIGDGHDGCKLGQFDYYSEASKSKEQYFQKL